VERAREVHVELPRCPWCHDAVRGGQEKRGCSACMAWHHEECFEEHGACAACGKADEASPPALVATRAPRVAPPRPWGPVPRRIALGLAGALVGVVLGALFHSQERRGFFEPVDWFLVLIWAGLGFVIGLAALELALQRARRR
jgi:hypothetical protein